MDNYIVYKHIFPNGKIYIGITKQKPNRRWRGGKSYSSNLRMSRAIEKYGWENIRHEIIADNLTEEEACKMEIRIISELGTQNPQRGYNLAPGGDHPNHSEETRKKIGEKSKGRTHTEEFKCWISERNSGDKNFMYGKHHSEETKRKISESKKGKKIHLDRCGAKNPASRAVVLLDKDTFETVFEFSTILEATTALNVAGSCAQKCLHGKQHTCRGYIWKYRNELDC